MYLIYVIDEVPKYTFPPLCAALFLLCLAENSPVAGRIQKDTEAHATMILPELDLAS